MDVLAGAGQAGFLPPQLVIQLGQEVVDAVRLFFEVSGAGRALLHVALQAIQQRRLRAQLFRVLVILGQPQGQAQLLEPVGIFLVTLRLGCLQLDAAELLVHLVDDVLEAEQVLIDTLQLAEGFDLFGLETADAGGFLEDGAALLG